MKKKKRVAIFGSTGSIGKSALNVLEHLDSEFEIKALAASTQSSAFLKQLNKYKPAYAAMADAASADKIKDNISRLKTKFYEGPEAVVNLAKKKDIDIVVMAISGSAALLPLIEAIKSSKKIALANKEALVMAGNIVMPLAKKYKATIIPVDSEHSAIFQCLNQQISRPHKIYITGSGGLFVRTPKNKLQSISPKQALNHPKWSMGKKITVDSATLMNKGLEVIEAMHLFNIPLDKIEVIVHPEAIIHSMVEYSDGSILAQMANPDMRLPIEYALSYPQRSKLIGKRISFNKSNKMTFLKADKKRFPCLEIAYEAARKGYTYPTVLNAANEVAVWAFLDKKIKFTDIPKVIEKSISQHKPLKNFTLKDIMSIDNISRKTTNEIIERLH
jgi:1-deoxy-D-xylulose-5-phosphate reductoisomerase